MARSKFLAFSPPFVGEEEIEQVVEAIRSGWITTGPKTKAFEKAFGQYLNSPGTLALNSCTAGLHVALMTLGIGRGDEVITTSMTFASSANVIEHTGAMPILVDIQSDTLNIDPLQVEAHITSKTRAVLAVHYAGHPAELDPLREICRVHGLYLIEDAAHSLPAKYKGVSIGSGANLASFSFYATKNLTTGEGGMLTGDPELLAKAKVFALHGMSLDAWQRHEERGSWFYEVTVPGFKYNMTDIQAAMGLAQLDKLKRMHERRQVIATRYTDAFASMPELETPTVRADVGHAWHLYVLRLNLDTINLDRDEFIFELKERKIGTSVHFIPVHIHPYYRDKYAIQPEDIPVAWEAYQRVLSLPLHPGLGDEDVSDVIEAVRDVIKDCRR